MKNSNKKVIICILVGIVILSCVIVGVILLNNKNKNEKQDENKNQTIILNDNLKFEINSEVNLLSLVSKDNKVKIISEDIKIDTSKLGEQKLTIKYLSENKEMNKTFTIKIVDTKPPTIEYQKELTIVVGEEIDLLKDVKVYDNSNEEIKATIEGEYDFNKGGTYKLKYVAKDSSYNKTEEEFTLNVNEKTLTPVNNTTSSNNTNSNNNTNQSNNTSNSQAGCEKSSEEYLELYSGKIFTSIPDNNPRLSWNSAKFYVTEEILEDGTIQYQLHNERISGANIGASAADAIREIIGDYSDMKYTKENPIILYQLGSVYNCQ